LRILSRLFFLLDSRRKFSIKRFNPNHKNGNKDAAAQKDKAQRAGVARPSQSSQTGNLEQVKTKLSKLAEEQSLRFISAGFVREPQGRVLRITIDSADPAKQITLDDCEHFHKAAVNIVESIDYDYLECSSRGADRQLETDEDLNESIGKAVEIRLYKPSADYQELGKRFHGTFMGIVKKEKDENNGESVSLDIDSRRISIHKKEISMIKLYVEVPEEG
jgi:ribosome maturation factor RimP